MQKQISDMTKQEKQNLLKKIEEDLKQTLSEKRYIHSIATMKKASELAKKYNQDELKVMLTALAHDIAKEMSIQEYYEYALNNNIEFSEDDKMCPNVLHGIIGASIVKEKYGFTKEMQDAIYYHTTGRANMTLFEKIIFLADKTEEKTRTQERAYKIREIMSNGKLDEAILFICDDYNIPKAIQNRTIIHPNTIYLRNFIILNKTNNS